MSNNSGLATCGDQAVSLTLSYLEIIERNLGITYNSQGEPICVPSEITLAALSGLAYELSQLLSGEKSKGAIEASKAFGEEHIQSIGFGHVSDFDAFIKIGFLYSERVVIWDILSSRILAPSSFSETSKSVIAEIACNLLLLRAVAEMGGVVVLPHPLTWSDTARNIAKELAEEQNQSSYAFGLSMALVAVDEGINLHPYTLAVSKDTQSAHLSLDEGGSVYSQENRNFVAASTAVMAMPEFRFLRDIKIIDFYKTTLAHTELHRALRKLFASLNGMSPQQARYEMQGISKELKQLAKARDKAISNYKIEGAVATAGLITSVATMAASPIGATMVALFGLSPAVITVTRRWLARPQRNVIVQAFSDLRLNQPFSVEFPTEIPNINYEMPVADPEVEQHVKAIAREHWTENAHLYLEELPEETAVRVLESLRPEQMYNLVNFRSRQHDYIGDYLVYVWDASPDAFWRHIEQTFISDEGMLMYDLSKVDDILTSEDMPLPVWMTFLRFIPTVYCEILNNETPHQYKQENGAQIVDYQLYQLVTVISYQLLESRSRVEKQSAFCVWLSNLDATAKATVSILIRKIFPNEPPSWLGGLI